MLAIGILIDKPEDDPERRLAIIDDAGHEIGTRARILQAIIRESRQIRLEVRSAALPFAVDHGSVLSPRYGVLDTLAWPDRRIAPEADHRLTTETPSTNGGRGGQSRTNLIVFVDLFVGTQGSQVRILPLRPFFQKSTFSRGLADRPPAPRERLFATIFGAGPRPIWPGRAACPGDMAPFTENGSTDPIVQ
ncbi:hypothetical protein UB31_19895 [Bradyrhizobium sp. LTSP849]|nr:hypothetical protein UB31_19895 [Bradyrhizobium sp. LTSP849]